MMEVELTFVVGSSLPSFRAPSNLVTASTTQTTLRPPNKYRAQHGTLATVMGPVQAETFTRIPSTLEGPP